MSDKLYRVEGRDRVQMLTYNEMIDRGIENIIRSFNMDILIKRTPEQNKKSEEAVRGIIDAYARRKVRNALDVVEHELEQEQYRLVNRVGWTKFGKTIQSLRRSMKIRRTKIIKKAMEVL